MAVDRIAFLVGNGFDDSELAIPRERLEAAGFEIEMIGARTGETVHGARHHFDVKIDHAASDADPESFIALVIPGGQSPDRLRNNENVVSFVRHFNATGRPLAAICHGPQLLMAAGLVKGRTLTAWPTVRRDLELVDDVTVRDEAVVVDDNWITSRKPDDLEAFCATLLMQIDAWRDRQKGAHAARRGPIAAEETDEGQYGALTDPGLIDPNAEGLDRDTRYYEPWLEH